MADQDRFIVNIVAVGQSSEPTIQSQLQFILQQTQFDYSDFHIVPYTMNAGDGWLINATADDVFQGNSATVDTVKQQFDAVMRQYFTNYESQIVSSQVIPAHQVATSVNPNTGQVTTTPHAPVSPNNITPSGKSWFDRTFFNGAGTLTGVGIGVLVVLGAIVVTQKR